MTEQFPTRGFNIVTPTIAETQLTGWIATAQFERRGHRFAVRFIHLRAPQCTRDGKAITWEALPNVARQTAHKAADWLNQLAKLQAA